MHNPNPDLDMMDLHQAFVQFGNPQLFPLVAKIGRQELVYGDERLVGASDWTNVRRTLKRKYRRSTRGHSQRTRSIGWVRFAEDPSSFSRSHHRTGRRFFQSNSAR
jgi:hypothetical protein